MSASRERGICEQFSDDPEQADFDVFGRRADEDRRGFLKRSGLVLMSALLGSAIPYWRNFPAGMIPVALAESEDPFVIKGKNGLRVLNDRPLNAETPVHLLDDDVTPTDRHFIRNNGIPPVRVDPETWRLKVDGEVESELELSIRDLRRNFDVVTLRLQLECGGNGRAAFNPPARGNQWSLGAIGNAEWKGVRYADVLRTAGLKPAAIYTGHFGADAHLSGQADKLPISRGIPVTKALDPNTLIAFEMNGQPIHAMNGAPLRIVAPGWPGSCSQKWLTRIWVRDRVHDGAKMTGTSYRVPKYPVAPGQAVPEEDFRVIESMPVKSIISSPKTGIELAPGRRDLNVRGHAWAGDLAVSAVDVSIDFGRSWFPARLDAPPNKFSWQSWSADLNFPTAGYYEVWARATDEQGQAQPFAMDWNPKGYLNNSMHRIAVRMS